MPYKPVIFRLLIYIFLACPVWASGQWELGKIFMSDMVLPRDKPVPVHGRGIPGVMVSLAFGKTLLTARVNQDSTWQILLPSRPASVVPQEMHITADSFSAVLQNILVGDVWLCIGQSNMQWPMQKEMHFAQEIAQAKRPQLRFFNPAYAGENIYGTRFPDSVISRLHPGGFLRGKWEVSDSQSIGPMSAVAYYFGKQIQQATGVPVGLIDISVGGAPLETFISVEVLAGDKRFSAKTAGSWLKNNALPVWVRERGIQNLAGDAAHLDTMQHAAHPFQPGFVYQCGIHPLLSFPVKGLLVYQGESNAQELERVLEYGALFGLMVEDYRKGWQNPDLPVGWVQLSSIDTIKYNGRYWGRFRDEQRKMLEEIPHSGMAVCSDIGARHDVHPTNKKAVGERLAAWALHDVYHHGGVPSGPLPIKARYRNGRVVVHFKYAGKGLSTSDGQEPRGFSAAASTINDVLLKQKRAIIAMPNKPDKIYYGWSPFTDANLVNHAKLPASTFSLELN